MVDPVSIGLAVGGSALGSIADRGAQKRKDKILRLMMERQGRQQAELDAMVMGEVGTMRGETPEAERAEAMSEFVGQLREARAAQPTSLGARGAVSDREGADYGDLRGDLGQFSNREADITARLDSQGRMRDNQDLRQGRLNTNMRQQVRKMQAADFLDKLRLARVKANPVLGAAGSIMKGLGQAGMGSSLFNGPSIAAPGFSFDIDPRTLPIQGL